VALLLFFWGRFLFHADPRFPGSLVGSALAIAGSALMLVPVLYSLAKRLFRVRGPSLRTLLAIHIYAGLVGPILVIVHTGHKFDNPVGVLLTTMTLIVVLSGFVGRYLLQACSRTLSEKRRERSGLDALLERARGQLASAVVESGRPLTARPGIPAALFPWAMREPTVRAALRSARELAGAGAMLDTSIALHERMQRWFRLWMRFHFALTAALYLLLAAHVLIVSYYGLRWLPG
jgi:predicted ferric reductase